MKIAIVDADLIGRDKHRFPNLACEKISGYWKEKGESVTLLTDYAWCANDYDRIYVSKVFTDTPVPDWIYEHDNIHVGGTGFYFDQAPALPDEIEHHMPDYSLYDEWIETEVARIKEARTATGLTVNEERIRDQFKEYKEYSIGFLTRGCFRKCKFCVNQKYDHVFKHSPLSEFFDPSRSKICLLDDNFLGCPRWKEMLQELIATGRPYKFKQGLDERLLTDEKCEMLFSSKYDGDLTFAFDNVSEYDIIEKQLKRIRRYTNKKNIRFYVLVGFESTDEFDIENAFKRVELLMRYHCIPYIMRYQNKNDCPWKQSPYRGIYIQLARWCNQQSLYKRMSFREFCVANQALVTTGRICAPYKAMLDFETAHPEIAEKYFDLHFLTRGFLNSETWRELGD